MTDEVNQIEEGQVEEGQVEDNEIDDEGDTSDGDPSYHVPTGKKDLSNLSEQDKIDHGVKERLRKIQEKNDTEKAAYEKRIKELEEERQRYAPQQQQDNNQYAQQQGQSQGQHQPNPQQAQRQQQLEHKLRKAALDHDDFGTLVNSQMGQMILANEAVSAAIEYADEPGEFLHNILSNNKDDIKNILLLDDKMLQYNKMIALHERLKSKQEVKLAPKPVHLDSDDGADLDTKDMSPDAIIDQEAANYHKRKVR